ncbi:MAG: sigma-54 dependent transcriptional regulator [Candidatus Margulisiibacteriota bacterium]
MAIMAKEEKLNVLIIDDESDMQETLKSILKKNYSPVAASNGKEGLKELKNGNFHLVLLDLRMPEMDGIEVLKKIKELDSSIPVIMVTASKDLRSAVEAMKTGAEDFVSKPFEVDELLAVIEKALDKYKLVRENQALKEILKDSERYCDLLGKTEKIKKVMSVIDSIAKTDSTVLIFGESGTGKEIAAKTIHKMSDRKNKPYIAINCAAIPENLLESELFGHERGAFTGALDRRIGKFELADQGTIFLDEIGCMSMAMQAKLLRILEDKKIERVGGTAPVEIDVRIISATNIDFAKAIKEGKFREDLYYRLNVIPIEMPALRERKEDIPLFIAYFLDNFNKELNKNLKGLSVGAQSLLMAYDFPGNVRELKNIIERAVALSKSDQITEDNLFGLGSSRSGIVNKTLKDACEEFEKSYILGILKENNNNQTQTSKVLNIARTTLASRMKALDI